MKVIRSDGSAWLIKDNGAEIKFRWYHKAMESIADWWDSRDWRRRQKEFERTGTRYYGDGGTIHGTSGVDVEVYEGRVVAVWFRCQALPFKANYDTAEWRAKEMDAMYRDNISGLELRGVEVKDRKREGESGKAK